MAVAVILAACGGGGGGSGKAGGESVTRSVGPDGGTVTSSDGRLTLDFPPGALRATNEITIETVAIDDLPPEFDALNADTAYELRPDGLTFDQPVTARFDLGDDPNADDGSIRMPLGLLFTRGNGMPRALDELSQDTDAETGLTRISGELSHFSPLIVFLDEQALLLVINGVPDSLAVNTGFDAQVVVALELEESFLDALDEVVYRDQSEPLLLTQPRTRKLPQDGPAFVDVVPYTCVDDGPEFFIANLELNGLVFDFDTQTANKARLFAQTGKIVTCTPPGDGSDPGDDRTASVVPLPGNGTPGPPTDLGFPFEPFDEATSTAETLLAVVTGDGQARAFDDQLVQQDQFFTGDSGNFRFAGAAVSYEFLDAGGNPDHQDGYVVGGADGGVLFQRFGDFGSRNRFTFGNVTDLYAFDQFSDDGDADSFAAVDFSGGEIRIFGPDPGNGSYAETDGSGVITNAAVDGEAIVSSWLAPGGWDQPGEIAWVLTNPAPGANDRNGWLWRCARSGTAPSVAADCSRASEVGRNPLRVRGAPPDAAGDTVLAVTSFDDETLTLDRANVFTGNMTRIDTVANVRAVTPAVVRDGGDVLFAVPDFDGDEIVGGVVRPDDTLETRRRAAPSAPPAGDPGGQPIACRGPEHLVMRDIGATLFLIGTCAGDPNTAALLFFLAYTAYFGFTP